MERAEEPGYLMLRIAMITVAIWATAPDQTVISGDFESAKGATGDLDIGFKVLTHMELKSDSLGYQAYLSYQRRKETLSQQNQPQGDDSRIRGMLPA